MAAPVSIDMQAGEKWWGLATGCGRQMLFDAASDLTVDPRTDIGQSCAPLLVSNRGRVIWCEKPLAVTFAKGKASVDAGDAEVVVEQGGTTLREAFLHASKRFFPPQGAPDLVFFDSPQLNTWIELTYNQNEKDILAYAESMVTNGVKPGIFMIDDTWQFSYGTWEFDPWRFPDPKGMFAYDKTATPSDQTRAWDLLAEKFPKSDAAIAGRCEGRGDARGGDPAGTLGVRRGRTGDRAEDRDREDAA